MKQTLLGVPDEEKKAGDYTNKPKNTLNRLWFDEIFFAKLLLDLISGTLKIVIHGIGITFFTNIDLTEKIKNQCFVLQISVRRKWDHNS